MNKLDDTILVAYTDGELDPATVEEVERRLAEAPALREKVQSLRESAALVRSSFNHVMYGPMPKPFRGTRSSTNTGKNGSVTNGGVGHRALRMWRRGIPIAATLAALVIGGFGGYVGSNLRSEHELRKARIVQQADEAAMKGAFSHVLEKKVSGTAVHWENPDSGNRGSVTPVRTYQAKSGRYCREFEEVRVTGGVSRTEYGIACRTEGGTWKIRLRYIPE